MPPGVQILTISCSFWEILAKSYVGAPPPSRELASPPRGNPGSATVEFTISSVANLGFPRREGGGKPLSLARKPNFCKIFTENSHLCGCVLLLVPKIMGGGRTLRMVLCHSMNAGSGLSTNEYLIFPSQKTEIRYITPKNG